MFLTPIVIGLCLVYVGSAAGAMAAIAMIPLMLAAIYVEDFPLTPYVSLEKDRHDGRSQVRRGHDGTAVTPHQRGRYK